MSASIFEFTSKIQITSEIIPSSAWIFSQRVPNIFEFTSNYLKDTNNE